MSDVVDDEGGDIPPTGGFPERRQERRRAEDEEAATARTIESWVAAMFVHRGKLIALCSVSTFLFTSLGFRILGPSQEIVELRAEVVRKDSLMNTRVTRLEEGQSQVKLQLAAIEEQLRFIAFLQCTSLRTTNPNLALDGCPAKRP